MSAPPPVVVLATADFFSNVWTNKQHLAVGLARDTEVTYIESFGLRRPRIGMADATRVADRIVSRRRAPRAEIPAGIRLIHPVVLPFHGAQWVRAINRRAVSRLRIPNLEESVLWTFSPITYGLETRAKAIVYHSVDLLHTQPGMPASTLLEAERALVHRADAVVASSTGVRSHLHALGRPDVHLWENVANVQLFTSAHGSRIPRAIFAGNITPTKIDAELLLAVVEAGVNLAIAGPIGIDGSAQSAQVRRLLRHPRTTYLGNLPPEELAREVGCSMVGVIPYVRNSYTAGVFPLKVYEYLAGGLDVVATPLPSLTGVVRPGVTIASGANFVDAVIHGITHFTTAEASNRSDGAQSYSWSGRARQALALLETLATRDSTAL